MLRSRRFLTAAFALWIGLVVAGFAVLASYETGAGDPGDPPPAWPTGSALPAPSERPALVVVSHPRCPCTQATLSELERLVRYTHGKADVYALFVQPEGLDDEWTESALWRRANAIPGVQVVRDTDGVEARRFRTMTSGHALVYSADGALLYTGGLTASRGHEGPNAGRTAVQDLIIDGSAERDEMPVYGCPLEDSEHRPTTT